MNYVSNSDPLVWRPTGRQLLEFCVVWLFVNGMRLLPRPAARAVGKFIGRIAYRCLRRLRRAGEKNLQMALPELGSRHRERILVEVYGNLGTLLAEFCKMPAYSRAGASEFIKYEGLDRYLTAQARGRGVFVLTGHLGAWELSSFYHSLMGYPMAIVIRRLDNPLVDRLVNRIRCLHGNRVVHKDDFARGLLGAMKAGETVGILMDTNMTPPQGVFVPFFGVQACTASGLARLALRTNAAVLPGFLLWEKAQNKYVLRFGEEVELVRDGDAATDIVTNTALFTAVIEKYVRAYPEQWLWMHRRWKTRPPGEPGIY